MSDKKQSITFREINTTYPGPRANFQSTSWTQGKSSPPQSIALRPTRDVPPPNWDMPPHTQNIPLILINGIPLSDLPANTPAGKAWIPEEEEYVEFTRPVVHGTIKFRRDLPLFPGSGPASDSSTGTTQDTPTSTGTLWPRVPPGFTEAHRGQANLYDRPLHLIPSGYLHDGVQGIHQHAGRIADPVTPRHDKTPTDVYSSASSYMSRNNMLAPIRTTGLNPVASHFTPGASPMLSSTVDKEPPAPTLAFGRRWPLSPKPARSQMTNHFTPGASPMVSTTTDKEPPRAPAAFSHLGQRVPLHPELARDKVYLDNQAEILRRSVPRPVWGGQARVQVRTDEARSLAGQQSHESRQVIEDEREHIDAVNDWYWAQAMQGEPAPKAEPKK